MKIAHRGASAYEPENTLRSFKRAVELKSDMIEFDVRQSVDGSLVVIHDARVDRTTNGAGLVGQKSLAELRELDAGMGEKIPTLEEALELGRGKTSFVIELKENGLEGKVVNLVRDFGLIEDVLIVSFKSVRLRMVKKLEPRLRTGLILFASPNPVRLAQRCGADAAAPFHWFVTKGMADRARRNGLHLFTWTVDEAGKARQLRGIGIKGIVTNKPDLI
ncbi:MAG: glycerophosphodiester phosphodiesterase family protein [Deltaproteobacteria bacterium]